MTSKGVILCGGPNKGTRMRPLTLNTPKSLFPIAGRPLIWHNLQAFSKIEGLNEVFLLGFHEADLFKDFLASASKDFPNLNIRYLREFESLGTAGGLFHFRDAISRGNPQHIYVSNGDIACHLPLEEMRDFHLKHGTVCTMMGVRVSKDASTKYGCVVIDEETQHARHYVEKPSEFISNTINGGIYLFDGKAIFDELKHAADLKAELTAPQNQFEPVDSDVLRLEQDLLAPLVTADKVSVYPATVGWYQIKTGASCIPANNLMLSSYKRTNPTLLRQRAPTVTSAAQAPPVPPAPSKAAFKCEIIEPCYIDETAQIDPTAKIGPNVSIGANVKIGKGCRVKEAILLDGVAMDQNAVVLNAILDERCRIGPWGRVEGRPLPADDDGNAKDCIAILASNVKVAGETQVLSCIVLPDKSLKDSSYAFEVLL